MSEQISAIDLLVQETLDELGKVAGYASEKDELKNKQESIQSNLDNSFETINKKLPNLLQLRGYEQKTDGPKQYFIRHNDINSVSDIVRYDDSSFMLARINEDDTDDFLKYDRWNRMSKLAKDFLVKSFVYGIPTAFGVIYGILATNDIAPRMGEGSTPAWDFGFHCFIGFTFSLIPVMGAVVATARKFDKKHEEREAKYGPDIYQDNWQEGSYNALEKALTPLTL